MSLNPSRYATVSTRHPSVSRAIACRNRIQRNALAKEYPCFPADLDRYAGRQRTRFAIWPTDDRYGPASDSRADATDTFESSLEIP